VIEGHQTKMLPAAHPEGAPSVFWYSAGSAQRMFGPAHARLPAARAYAAVEWMVAYRGYSNGLRGSVALSSG
jgi:hypothetical protein